VDEVQRQVELKHLVEDIGILFEELGMPRMAGRILGWLSLSQFYDAAAHPGWPG